MKSNTICESESVLHMVSQHSEFCVLSSSFRQLCQHEFLQRCRSQQLTQPELKHFLLQHQSYSKHFLRYLFLLMSHLNHVDDTKHLLHNVLEELGEDEHHSIAHTVLQQEMLHNLGVGHIIEPPLPQTTALIDRMTHYCANADPLCGLTALCLGAEAIVPMLYSAVYQAARGLGYTAAQLKYLQLHIECDDGHALTMYQIITRRTVSSPHMVKPVIAIAREMLEYRCNFLTALMLPESKALP